MIWDTVCSSIWWPETVLNQTWIYVQSAGARGVTFLPFPLLKTLNDACGVVLESFFPKYRFLKAHWKDVRSVPLPHSITSLFSMCLKITNSLAYLYQKKKKKKHFRLLDIVFFSVISGNLCPWGRPTNNLHTMFYPRTNLHFEKRKGCSVISH